MAVVWAWVGAPTDTGAVVSAEIAGAAAGLLVSTDPGMAAPVAYAPVPTVNNVAKLTADGLLPDSQYYYQISDDGVTDTGLTGSFRTFPAPGSPASFSIVAGSCAGAGGVYPGVLGDELVPDRVSNAEVFDTIRARNPLMWVHLGDRGYYDLGSGLHGIVGGGSLANYRTAYRDNSRQPRQLALQSQVSTAYIYHDHDWAYNDSDSTVPDAANSRTVYREIVPHYPLADSITADQYWHIGRVAFILSDCNGAKVDGNTMLGAAQLARLHSFLAGSTAEALVWLMPDQWMGVATPTWASYPAERNQIVAWLEEYGWTDRMVMVYGDRHALGLDTGGNNIWGGFPVLQAASYDTSFPASPVTTRFDTGPDLPGRNQYGVVDVLDTVDQISLTLTGYVGTDVWRTYTLVIPLGTSPGPGPGPTPTPDPVATAVIRNRVEWYGADLVTGRVISTIPDIFGRVSRVIGNYTTAGLTLPIPITGPAAMPIELAEQLTEPGRAMIVAVVNDIPTWAGLVGKQTGGTRATMDVPVVSLEGYLHRRYVRDHDWSDVDESVIVAGLLGDAGDIDIPGLGMAGGIGLVIDAPPTGTTRDREYRESDRKTVYEALQELMDVQGGPEWTIDVDWSDETHTAFSKIFRLRPRIGSAAESPSPAVFRAHSVYGTRTGAEATYQLERSYLDGDGANYVVAYSSGEGDDQPSSVPAIAGELIAAGWPVYEYAFQPSSSIISQDVLDSHAAATLDRMRAGSEVITLSARWDAYPRYGVDWQLGDDIAWDLIGHRNPAGLTGQGRAIGFTLDMRDHTIEPILKDV